MVYHGDNKKSFSFYIGSDSMCTAPSTDPCVTSISDQGSFTVNYSESDGMLVMNATLPDSSYAGWGWGSSMTNTEMVIFSADGADSSATTYYSKGENDPTLQETLQSCYETSVKTKKNNFVEFTTKRPLDCNVEDSYVV
mmetsp:Transcript_6602/g.8962  ORF Transcript_6602/g.8962 Transcript_6602/m.8962 type:complete len:139 (+) Transcript_6602:1356-1772(+)